jgi:alpha-glutamyl/putrescinyl thymine pyrophosphorylase clade 1
MSGVPAPTEVFDSYWRFAAERLAIYYRRLNDPVGPWTDDLILREYRFTNTFRVADRVSQYLVREVQYREDRSQAPAEVFFRTVLFKLFNRIETWEALERELGPLSWQTARLEAMSAVLDYLMRAGRRVYSAAYIMPSPAFGHRRKHFNHLAVLARMMDDRLPYRLAHARSLRSAYEMILNYPGLGPFLAFQYTIDLNYSTLLNFDEIDFVVAGPGALDGISKCFANAKSLDPTYVIHAMMECQDEEFSRLGIEFHGLFGRRLQPIDCQNLFCEISKYARVAHPHVGGSSGRTRIKQRYRAVDAVASASPYFPPKWNLKLPPLVTTTAMHSESAQLSLL